MDKLKNIAPQLALPIVLIYFFFNGVFLPEGLLYTVLLSPLFLYLTFKERLFKPYLLFTLGSIAYFVIHLSLGIDLMYYLRSWVMMFSSFIFCITVYVFIRKEAFLDYSFKSVLAVNTLLLPIAVAAYFSPLKSSFWYLVPISPDLPIIPRLKMLTYEASYYSLLLVPVVIYYFFKLIFEKGQKIVLITLALSIPLILSFSLGVLGGLAICFALVFATHLRWIVLHKRFKNSFFILTGISILVLLALVFFFPDNPLFRRIQNIPSGADTSARGRTYEAFELAWLMAKEKSVWFGIGLGQIKLLGRDIIIQYYQYVNMPEVARLPNAAAETLAQFGIVGLSIRIGTQIILFFKTRVWSNFFRLTLFLFVFIYQFTGSFMINIAELILWVMAFSPVVPEMNKWELFDQLKIPRLKAEKEKKGNQS